MAFTSPSSLTFAPLPPDVSNKSRNHPTSSTALNLFAALHVGGLKVYRASELGLLNLKVRVAGVGGSASIEVGRQAKKQLVAVKRSRVLSEADPNHSPSLAFDRHFDQLVLELRILGHRKIRKNPHVVNVVGVCMDEFNGAPALDLVFEYSDMGSLMSFLVSKGVAISASQRANLILQVAQGLAAFHDLRISHGDVKTQNVLVFPSSNTEEWLAKVADCGGSLIAPQDNPSAKLVPQTGTRLFNAPEIRKERYLLDGGITIEGAMLTDIFSFGLLAWEVCKGGSSFLDPLWVGADLGDMDPGSIVEVLNGLPTNQLQLYGLVFLGGLGLEEPLQERLSLLLKGSLQDDAECRQSMQELIGILQEPAQEISVDSSDVPEDASSESLGEILEQVFGVSLSSWTTNHSLYEVLDHGRMQGYDFSNDLPLMLRERILSELKALATSKAFPQDVRAHAAMIVSECYTIGFCGEYDFKEILAWLNTAAVQGLEKANLWYHRICDAFGASPSSDSKTSPLDDEALCSLPSSLYLIGRIHLFNRTTLQQTLTMMGDFPWGPESESIGDTINLPLFNQATVDALEPLHLAAWLGEDEVVGRLLQVTSPSSKSKLGLNAVHYACLGGNLSTLRILLQNGAPLVAAEYHNITPLHFSIFFGPKNVKDAVELLLARDILVETCSKGEITWDAHDLSLHGTALDWAVCTRYGTLVKLLAPHHKFPAGYSCLLKAIGRFFWEIAEDLLPYFEGDPELSNDYTRLQTISRPFFHWLAHGTEGPQDIENTVRLSKKHGLLGQNKDGSTHLQGLVSNASTEDDLRLIRSVISNSSSSYIKQTIPSTYDNSTLHAALQMSRHRDVWSDVIRDLASFYTVDELQDDISGFGNYLASAVQNESLVGVRILLEKGVDVNKPTSRIPPSTAIFDCISMFGSTEMISLLMENGADILTRHPITGTSPLQSLFISRSQKPLLENLLKHSYPDEVYFQSLQIMLEGTLLQLARPEGYRADSHEIFRYMLTQESFAKYIDQPDGNGRTLIQQASYALHIGSVRLLLDAQADASIPFQCAQGYVLPLQIACSQGRGLSAIAMQEDIKDTRLNQERRSQAMDVAVELLEWHYARGDSAFRNITRLHLACRMIMESEVEKLVRDGYDPEAKGSWPGVEQQVTPYDLLSLDLQDFTVTNSFKFTSIWETLLNPTDPEHFHRTDENRDDLSSLSSISDLSELSFD